MNNENFNFDDLPFEAQDESISESDFKLVDYANRTHEQKFQTKPTTFFKDSLKRFAKNKSSVVATGILGTLLLLSLFVPIFDKNDTIGSHPEIYYLEPKLFEAGTGFWDGTRKEVKQAVDIAGHENATTEEEKQEYWWPAPDSFNKSSVSNKKFTDFSFTNQTNTYANGGYVQFGISKENNSDSIYLKTTPIDSINLDSGDIYLKELTICNMDDLKVDEGDKAFFPDNYVQGKVSFFVEYYQGTIKKEVQILDKSESIKVKDLNITNIIKNDTEISAMLDKTLNNCCFGLKMENPRSGNNECVLIKNLSLETTNSAVKGKLESCNFDDANKFILRESDSTKESTILSNTTLRLHMAKIVYCDFTYDSYDAVFGIKEFDFNQVSYNDMLAYKELNWCNFNIETGFSPENPDEEIVIFKDFVVLDDRCPVLTITKVEKVGNSYRFYGTLQGYKKLGYNEPPKFLMGTDVNGYDMLKYVFEGLRTSLALGIISFAVCFVIGLIWGAISGYFGGTVDLVMERITDVISGLPWIVVMTLALLHFGQTFFTFGLSICLTGWIGTASTTRTQFYRYRGREYVLASRSLGASDVRLIAKHILPNAMGTIITSSVLMIPSTIFSEATISYLGLGLNGMSSLGVVLSRNQGELTVHPYLLIFPAIIIALLMISFNLFGNGLRDAVNPSLKGED